MAKKSNQWNPKYELLPIVDKYNLASIKKIGYKEIDGKCIKPQGAQADDKEDEHEVVPKEAQEGMNVVAPQVPNPIALATPSLDQIISFLGQLQLSISKLQQNF